MIVNYHLNMNKRSKSERQILNNHPKRQKRQSVVQNIDQLKQQKQQIKEENQMLHKKINQSTPILQTIYDKVKKKQQLYQQEINEKDSKYKNAKELAKEYKEYCDEGIRLFKKHEVVDEFKGITSYRNSKAVLPNMSNFLEQKGRPFFQSKQKDYKPKVESKIIQRLRMLNAQKTNKITQDENNQKVDESIYQKYKSKLESAGNSSESVINRVRKLSKQIDQDIQRLKLNKNSSLKSIKEQRTTLIKDKAKYNKIQKGSKQYFLEVQKRKLKLL